MKRSAVSVVRSLFKWNVSRVIVVFFAVLCKLQDRFNSSTMRNSVNELLDDPFGG